MKIKFYKTDDPSDFEKARLFCVYFIDADDTYRGIKGVSKKRKGYAAVRTTSGSGIMDIYGKKNIVLPAGSLFAVPAWKLIRYRPLDGHWDFRWFEFEAPQCPIPEESVVFLPVMPEEISFLDMVFKVFESGSESAFETASAMFTSTLYLWKNRIGSPEKTDGSGRLSDICEMLKHEPQKNYSVPELAEKCALSVRGFRDAFKKKYGISPKEYMLRIKMERAEELLVSTTMNISSIAESVGFSDRFYFSRMFKSRYGRSPVSFRHHEIR